MSRIIPAILVKDENELRRQISLAAAFAKLVQIDVLDGTLFPERSFSDAGAVMAMHLSMQFEAHLMVNEPEKKVMDWVRAGASRIIIHIEAEGNIGLALERIRHSDRLAGIAFNPDTGLSALENFAPFIDHVQIMGVHPGGQGRSFDPETAMRVRAVKKAFPKLTVSVDGGVTDAADRARDLAACGADDLVVGSALWRANDPSRAYREIAADAKI
jgi:ribulose-phosphate 3-epimerase